MRRARALTRVGARRYGQRMALRARDIMTTRVVTVGPDDTLDVAVHKMTELRFSALPVIDRRFRLVGTCCATARTVAPTPPVSVP
jgi:CBS-domain-containing membrane protein